MKRLLVVSIILVFTVGAAFAGGQQEQEAETESQAAQAEATDMQIPGLIPAPEVITTYGPEGDPATWYDELYLTAEEVQRVRDMELTAAYEMVTDIDWSRGNLRGFRDACEVLGIEVVATASAELDPIRQKANMENFMALQPDIITCQPQDLDLAASTFDPLVEAGIHLVFLSNVPTGYKAGEDYVAGLTDSLVDMGHDAADLMAEAIGGEGQIITVVVAGVNYVTNTRDQAFVDRIESEYPNIEIVAEGGFQAMSEAGPQASGLLTRYPDAEGVYVSFSNPAIDVLEAVRTLGKEDVQIVTMDLDTVAAIDMVQDGNVYGIVSDSPYSMGYGRAMLGAYGALGKDAPKYVTSPAFKVTKDNILEGWEWAFGVEPPRELLDAME